MFHYKILESLFTKTLLKKNLTLKNNSTNKNELYIIGNGSSLKYYDMSSFIDKPSITCGYFFINKNFKNLNILAHTEIDPFILYPYHKNKFYNKYQKNLIREIYTKCFPMHEIPLVTSLTNLIAFKNLKNIFFTHHFGTKNNIFNIKQCNLSSSMMFMSGSVYFMIAFAYYLGFKKIYLVG